MIVTRYKRPIGYSRFGLDLFNEFLNSVNSMQNTQETVISDFNPSVNTRESQDSYHIEVDLPGIKKDDVDINIEDNILTISGKREIKNEQKEENYYKIESSYGTFSRSFTLPQKIDTTKIEGEFTDGVLEVVIPKQNILEESKKIEIK